MILEQIKEKLEELGFPVFYGLADGEIVQENYNNKWDYIVFNRLPSRINENKTGISQYYAVNIIKENFIPEEFELDVIRKMREIPGMKLGGNDISPQYLEKPNTNDVIELMTIEFVKAVKFDG